MHVIGEKTSAIRIACFLAAMGNAQKFKVIVPGALMATE